jgi:hypothetical protein
VARLVAPTLGWSDDEIVRQVDAYRALVQQEFVAAGLPLR